jgi:PAT family beta-lactamase induction signal transducer AmpG
MAPVTQVTPRRFRLRDIVEDRRIVLMLALGFSSGLPLLLVLGTFTLRLAFSDIDVKTIGLFSYVALPYSLKFLWAPMIDRLDVPVLSRALGRRRAWMVTTQIATAACLLVMAFADPKTDLALLGFGAFLVAFCAASQDVVIDGWRIDAAGSDLQGILAATSNLGYRLGLITAGAGALFIAASGGWTAAYLSMAGMMLVGLVAALLAPSYDNRKVVAGEAGRSRLWSARRALVEPLTELHGRFGRALVLILLLVALFRLPDFLAGVMASPLYRTLGFDLKEIATVTKLYGIWVGIAGGFAGGWALARLGLFPTLLLGGFLAAASHLSFAWLSAGAPELWRLIIAISIENFCGSFAGIVLIAYMSSLTSPAYAATQYALFSSLYALPGKLIAGSAGFIVAAIGYPAFFTLTSLIGLPVLALCVLVGRRTGKKTEEIVTAEDGNSPTVSPLPSPARPPAGEPKTA